MYSHSLFDLDGHGWQVMWMKPAEAQHAPEKVGTGSSPSRGSRT